MELGGILIYVGIAGSVIALAIIGYLFWRDRKAYRNRGFKIGKEVTATKRSPSAIPGNESANTDAIDSLLANLEGKVGITVGRKIHRGISAEARMSEIRSRLKNIDDNLRPGRDLPKPVPAESTAPLTQLPDIDPGPVDLRPVDLSPRPFSQSFAEAYNQARIDREARNSFWTRFQTTQLGNRNATEQRMGRAAESDFRTASPGDFLAIADDSNYFLVVPNFGTVIDETSVKYGGVGDAFKVDMSPGTSYQNFQLLEPAKFRKNGDHWSIVSPGRIDVVG